MLAGLSYDCETELYADLHMSQLSKGNQDYDVCGHYAQPDVFELKRTCNR